MDPTRCARLDTHVLLALIRMAFVSIPLRGIVACSILMGLSACSTGPELDVAIYESDRGAVYLERMGDRSFQAAHPVRINTDVIASLLRGIHVRDQQGLLQELLAGSAQERRVFSEEDVSYFAPLISDGLTRAAPDQQIAFQVVQSADVEPTNSRSPGTDTERTFVSTRGSLYAYGRSLYVRLDHYRRPIGSTITTAAPQRGLPDSTGLAKLTVSFSPTYAQRPDTYRSRTSAPSTLVLDLDRLAALQILPKSTATEGPGSVTPSPSTDLREPQHSATGSAQKDSEIEELRKELQDIKRQLAEQEEQRRKTTRPKP